MAIANLHETLLAYTMRKNQLSLDIMGYQATKALAVAQTADTNSLLSAGKAEIRDYFKNLYRTDEEEYRAQGYKNYTEIPDFEEQIDMLTAQMQEELEELAAWEQQIDQQITVASAELEEIKAYEESMKTMLSSNIQEDFNFGIN